MGNLPVRHDAAHDATTQAGLQPGATFPSKVLGLLCEARRTGQPDR